MRRNEIVDRKEKQLIELKRQEEMKKNEEIRKKWIQKYVDEFINVGIYIDITNEAWMYRILKIQAVKVIDDDENVESETETERNNQELIDEIMNNINTITISYDFENNEYL